MHNVYAVTSDAIHVLKLLEVDDQNTAQRRSGSNDLVP